MLNEKSVEPVFSGHPRKIRKWPFNTAGLTLNTWRSCTIKKPHIVIHTYKRNSKY